MTVKSFVESNSLSVEMILNLCKKLEINVDDENDNLSEDDKLLLEYELEEFAKANSGLDGSAEGGESSSSFKKKKSSDGSDFHIDNETFAAAYKCLVDAVNMLGNGLGDLSGLNPNGLKLIDGSTDIYNANLSSITSDSSNLQNRMTNTIISLSRMNYENANYFKDTLGNFLKEGKNDLNDYLASDEYKADLKMQEEYVKYKDEIDELYKLINGGTYFIEDPTTGFYLRDPLTGMYSYDVDKFEQAAKKLGVSELSIVQDLITNMNNNNSFNKQAPSYVNSVASEYGFGSNPCPRVVTSNRVEYTINKYRMEKIKWVNEREGNSLGELF